MRANMSVVISTIQMSQNWRMFAREERALLKIVCQGGVSGNSNSVSIFSCPSRSIPTMQWLSLTEWMMIHQLEQSTQQCAHIWSDNLQLPYANKLEVIWDQTTFNFLKNATIETFQGGHLGRYLTTYHYQTWQDKEEIQERRDRKDRRDRQDR